MAAERCVEPPLREKDVAGTLDLFQQVEAGTDVPLSPFSAQRVMQIPEPLQHPWLVLAVLGIAQALEKTVTDDGVGGHGRQYERQTRLSIRVRDTVELLAENVLRPVNVTNGELQGHGRVIPFSEG